jgi:ketosteroid isomerase-like protein
MTIRDAAETDVLATNEAFYEAFRARNVEAMEAVWAVTLPIACIHPGWTVLRGRARVIASFRGILEGEGAPTVTCSGATAHVLGETAYVVCYEDIPGLRLVATNVFAREDGTWRMVHHQSAPLSRIAADDDQETRADDEPEAPTDPSKLN